MKKIVVNLFLGVFVLLSATACLDGSEPGGGECTQEQIDWFWEDLSDGELEGSHECGGQSAPTTPDGDLGIDAPEPKQPACNMEWSLEWDVPASGPYNLNWTPQTGATSYEVVITGPNGEQTVLKANSSDLTLMMQDYPEGSYTFEVRAKDLFGNDICAIAVEFNKPVADAAQENSSIQQIQSPPNEQEEEQEEHLAEPPQPEQESEGFVIIIIPGINIQPVEQPK
jgi:hypothetical protein